MTANERRTAHRFALDLDLDLHAQGDVDRVRVRDVSRHGLFILCKAPPALDQVVLLTVPQRAPTGPASFDMLATVVRRVDERSLESGAGLRLYCVGADGKERWDRIVAALEHPGIELPTRTAHQAGACFLVQPRDTAGLMTFYTQHILSRRTLHVTPAVRLLGADLSFVLVHPVTHEESVHRATVVDWNAEHPNRMGVRFAPVDIHARQAFRQFIGESSASPVVAELIDQAPRWQNADGSPRRASEYAFFAPPRSGAEEVVVGVLAEDAAEELDKNATFDFSWTNADAPDET